MNHPAPRLVINIVYLSITMLFLQACTPTSLDTKIDTQNPYRNQDARAIKLLENDDLDGAVKIWRSLSKNAIEPYASLYGLKAVEHLMLGDFDDDANLLLQSMKAKGIASELTTTTNLLEILYQAKSYNLVGLSSRLKKFSVSKGDPEYSLYLHNKALILEANNKTLLAARERIQLDAQPNLNRLQRRNNQFHLYNTINGLSLADLNSLKAFQPNSMHTQGWADIAGIARSYGNDPDGLVIAIAHWKLMYPNHTANQHMVELLTDPKSLSAIPVQYVALMLPFTGNLASVANLVKDGFIGAWEADSNSSPKPEIQLYDTSEDILKSYNDALADGADLVIGPLKRENVQSIYDLEANDVTVLALNTTKLPFAEITYPSNISKSGFPSRVYQFGLLPEEEVINTVMRMRNDGCEKVGIFVPENGFGERLMFAFQKFAPRLALEIVTEQTYTEEPEELNISLGKFLKMTEEEPEDPLAEIDEDADPIMVPGIEIDCAFLSAMPEVMRQLNPLFAFNRATFVRRYATSSVYSGTINRLLDLDLEGIYFSEMPWILTPAQFPELRSLQKSSRTLPTALRGFHALGVDAYRLMNNLWALKSKQLDALPGATGSLSITPDGIVQRQAQWVQFIESVPILLPDNFDSTIQN